MIKQLVVTETIIIDVTELKVTHTSKNHVSQQDRYLMMQKDHIKDPGVFSYKYNKCYIQKIKKKTTLAVGA